MSETIKGTPEDRKWIGDLGVHLGATIEDSDVWAAIRATSRPTLLEVLRAIHARYPREKDAPLVTVHMPCGARFVFEDVAEIPGDPLECRCGTIWAPHFVIWYGPWGVQRVEDADG